MSVRQASAPNHYETFPRALLEFHSQVNVPVLPEYFCLRGYAQSGRLMAGPVPTLVATSVSGATPSSTHRTSVSKVESGKGPGPPWQ